jgi:1-acyl-sn-glycerol-3-phosphate acyltransferase
MLRRRLITIPGYVIAWSLWLGAAPLWLPLAVVVDLVRRSRGVALRSSALVTVYLSCEIMGMAASAGVWAWKSIARVDTERWTDLHFRLEAWWGTTLFRAVVRIFGLRLQIESDAELGRGPYLLLLRHASTGDTLLASALVSRPYGLRLRYVLKQELLWDPCLDIVGNRLPNVFVDRFSDDSVREVLRVQELARNLGPRDGILIYPEGTRFSEAKRRRALDRFQQNGNTKMLEYARSLAFVLPPRPGGIVGLLEAAPEADVVVCAHTGFESAASLAQIWKGALVHQVIRVQFRRIPRDEIPTGRDAQIAWLLEEWRRVGAWVESHQSSPWK